MNARVCRSCGYGVVSKVVTDCPQCGARLARSLPSGAAGPMAVGILLALGTGGWLILRAPAAPATPPLPPPGSGASPRASAPPAPVSEAGKGGTATDVDGLVAQLHAPGGDAWSAAFELAKRDDPRAHEALMAVYRQRDYGKMAGAAAFYARRRPPQYASVLVNLLHESKDLAVAQDLILSKDPKLAGPATAWAAEQGLKLVPSAETPTGVTWTSAH
ncbi:MAG TPA: hypothetical protein VMR21_11390 [Vicinamibacteria bacterium]|nr:hypothetical protein [Vicinamibacteria bacterium]